MGYFFEIFITVQQDGAMLHRDLGDAAIYRAADGDSFAPQFKINPGSPLPRIGIGSKDAAAIDARTGSAVV